MAATKAKLFVPSGGSLYYEDGPARGRCVVGSSLADTEAVLDIDAENARARYWHTDVTFVPAFPLFSVCVAW